MEIKIRWSIKNFLSMFGLKNHMIFCYVKFELVVEITA